MKMQMDYFEEESPTGTQTTLAGDSRGGELPGIVPAISGGGTTGGPRQGYVCFTDLSRRLLSGEIVTVPTETVEGYAVSLNSKKAIEALMVKKERGFDSGKVFTLIPEDKVAISKYAIISPLAKSLIAKYFPGELTLILPKNPNFQHFYYDHFEKIGLRIPNHDLFPPLLKTVGPLLLTSANEKGGTPRSLTGHLPSTIIDLTDEEPKILRQGNLIVQL